MGESEPAPPAAARVLAPAAARVLALQQTLGNAATSRLIARQEARSPTIGSAAPSTMSSPQIDQELRPARSWYTKHEGDPDAAAVKERISLLERELVIRQGTGGGPVPGMASFAPGVSADPLSPFGRPPSAREWAMIRGGRALHYTSAENAAKIAQPGGTVILKPSPGVFKNLTAPGMKESGYFFLGEPGEAAHSLNLAGRGPKAEQAFIVVEGVDLPPGTVFRPLDETLIVPGTYEGPGTVVFPGGKMPAASKLPPPVCPSEANTVPEPGLGKTGGAVVALSIVSGIAHAQNVAEERDTKGYSPAGPVAAGDQGIVYKIGRWLIDPFLDTQSSAGSRFNVGAWRATIRRRAAEKKTGETLEINWQVHKQGLVMQEIDDVSISYEKLPNGSWRPSRPMLDNIHKTPDLNTILGSASDAEVEMMLFPGESSTTTA